MMSFLYHAMFAICLTAVLWLEWRRYLSDVARNWLSVETAVLICYMLLLVTEYHCKLDPIVILLTSITIYNISSLVLYFGRVRLSEVRSERLTRRYMTITIVSTTIVAYFANLNAYSSASCQ